jgi:hypothetical protein
MSKQLLPGNIIVKPSSGLSLAPKERTALVGEYLYKYAVICNRQVDEEMILIYCEALKDLPLSRLKAGLVEWLEEGDAWPWPSQIREAGSL